MIPFQKPSFLLEAQKIRPCYSGKCCVIRCLMTKDVQRIRACFVALWDMKINRFSETG